MGILPSLNGEAMQLAERLVTAVERIATAIERTPKDDVRRQAIDALRLGQISQNSVAVDDARVRCVFCGRPGGACAASPCGEVLHRRELLNDLHRAGSGE